MIQITEDRFKAGEQVRNIWNLVMPVDHKMKQLLEPDYWSLVARYLRPMDRIEVYKEDGSEWAELLVLFADRVSAKVHLISSASMQPYEAAPVDPAYRVHFAGPAHKWRVQRISDKVVIQKGFDTEQAAKIWLQQYVNTVSA